MVFGVVGEGVCELSWVGWLCGVGCVLLCGWDEWLMCELRFGLPGDWFDSLRVFWEWCGGRVLGFGISYIQIYLYYHRNYLS